MNDLFVEIDGQSFVEFNAFCSINKISRRTAYNWKQSKKIKTIKKGRKIYVFIPNKDINFFTSHTRRKEERIIKQLQTIQVIVNLLINSLSGKENK